MVIANYYYKCNEKIQILENIGHFARALPPLETLTILPCPTDLRPLYMGEKILIFGVCFIYIFI